jgi:hypothetical protein
MNQLMSESVQASVRPHECKDLYYADKHNSEVQCFPAIVENRFVVALPSLNGGSTSTITFNPDGGISDIVLTAVMPQPGATAGNAAGLGLALTRGWLYQLVDRISVRYAGSSLYFFGGEQELIQILAECEDSIKRDNMLALGGAEIKSPADWANADLRTASIYLKLPHNSPSAQEKPPLFPTDVLSAPVQIQIQWKPFASVFLANAITNAPAGGALASLSAVQATMPTAFSSAEVQFKQTHLQDRADSIASREDLSKHALSIPLKSFIQTQYSTALTSETQTLNLTGFRSGSVQGIYVWVVANTDLTSVGAKQPLRYLPIKNVELSVNGLVYFRANNNSSQIWDLVERKTAAQFSTTTLDWDDTANVYVPTAAAGYFVYIPFAQHTETLAGDSMLSNGLGIANSVVNLSISTGLPGVACTLYASYAYNATILASGG